MSAPTTSSPTTDDDTPRDSGPRAAQDPFDKDVLPTVPGATGALLRSLLAPMRVHHNESRLRPDWWN